MIAKLPRTKNTKLPAPALSLAKTVANSVMFPYITVFFYYYTNR